MLLQNAIKNHENIAQNIFLSFLVPMMFDKKKKFITGLF